MDEFSKRIAALSPAKRALLKKRLQKENIDLDIPGIDGEKSKIPPIKPVEKKDYYPLSSVQKRLFLVDQLEETGLAYNVPVFREITGNTGKKHIEDIFKTLVKRHETFRTSFQFIAGEPVQRVHEPIDFQIDYYDLEEEDSKLPIPNITGNFIRPFALSKAPLLRVGLIKLPGGRAILMMDMHHIISDQASKRVLVKEFFSLYSGRVLPRLMIQYKDFAQWHDNGPVKAALKTQETYWLQEFSGEIPVLNLPGDYPRPQEKDYSGSSLSFKIGEKDTALLKTLALKENTTLFILVFSLYLVFLSKISNQKDIVVGTPVIGRSHAGLESIIGMFVNTLPLRNRLDEDQSFNVFLQGIKKRTLEAFENRDYLFEDLVNRVVKSRDTARNPIFDVFFTFTYPDVKHIQPAVSFQDEAETAPEATDSVNESGYSMFDMFLFGAEIGEELFFGVTYSTGLFKKRTVERFIKYFREIVSAVGANDRVKLKDIEISHDLGIAKVEDFHDEDEEFGF